MALCHYHQDRPGVGVCIRCRKVICAACCTRLDGVNHCHVCLRELATRTQRPRRRASLRAVGAVLLLAAGWLMLLGLGWLVQGRLAP